MEVRGFCIALLTVMILLCAQDQEVDAAFLRISPNRLQFFEYESVTFYCEGVFYCDIEEKSVMKTPSCCTTNNRTSRGPSCTIENLYRDDSGKYWCEKGGERRNTININVTSGSVILESPARPVTEGEDVTLSCRTKISSSNIEADFYKDGVHNWSSSTGNQRLKTVSMSDEGLYKCHISGFGESPQSWLSVGVSAFSAVDTGDHEDSNPASSSSTSIPWIIISILLMLVLLVVGLRHFDRGICSQSPAVPDSDSSVHQTVSVQDSAAQASQAMYANVTKNRNTKDENVESSLYYALVQDVSPQLAAESSVPAPALDPADSAVYYSTIKIVAEG